MTPRGVLNAGIFDAFAYESIAYTTAAATNVTAATILTTTKRAMSAFISVEDGSIRLRYDGVAPTVSEGHIVANGDSIVIVGYNNIKNIKIIAQSGSATGKLTYEGGPV